jgi:hypothetical protein
VGILQLSTANGGTIAVGLKERLLAFALEWSDNKMGNRTIYAALFVDDHGNHKVLHIFGDKVSVIDSYSLLKVKKRTD